MTKPYNPLDGVNRAKRSMQSYIRKNTPPAMTVSTTSGPIPCCVLLRSLTEGGPVPDDYTALRTSDAIKSHVRADGARYIGAFELQGDRNSVVLVYGPTTMSPENAERLATQERPELVRRHQRWTLGPFAASPVSQHSTHSPPPLPTAS